MTRANRLEPILIVPDAHIPYHDTRAWGLMLRVGQALKPTHLLVVGDLADFYSVSSHSKNPDRINRLGTELDAVSTALDQLDKLGATNKLFIAGNHEDRLTRYLQDKAPELFDVIDIPSLFKLKKRGWHYTPYKRFTRLGKLRITHDVGTAGRFAAYRALEKFEHSVVTGHTHRLCYVVEGNAEGEYKLSAQFGWLGDASKVDYMAQINVNTNWALGFGVGGLDATTGIVYLTPVPIVVVKGHYTCAVHGVLYTN